MSAATKQTKSASLIEALVNVAAGFGLSIICQGLVLPLLGVEISLRANFAFACVMTAVSICRQFVLRRVFEALHIRRPLSPAMQAIISERFRQIEVEGWDLTHDDEHPRGMLAKAGAAYAANASSGLNDYDEGVTRALHPLWPWSRGWWKPENFRRDLVKACALILAEIEKFDRSRKLRSDWDKPRPPGVAE